MNQTKRQLVNQFAIAKFAVVIGMSSLLSTGVNAKANDIWQLEEGYVQQSVCTRTAKAKKKVAKNIKNRNTENTLLKCLNQSKEEEANFMELLLPKSTVDTAEEEPNLLKLINQDFLENEKKEFFNFSNVESETLPQPQEDLLQEKNLDILSNKSLQNEEVAETVEIKNDEVIEFKTEEASKVVTEEAAYLETEEVVSNVTNVSEEITTTETVEENSKLEETQQLEESNVENVDGYIDQININQVEEVTEVTEQESVEVNLDEGIIQSETEEVNLTQVDEVKEETTEVIKDEAENQPTSEEINKEAQEEKIKLQGEKNVLPAEQASEEVGELVTFKATAYCPCSSCCGKSDGITESGAVATQWHTVAAGKAYPMGTRIYIPALADQPNGGWFVVEDRGSAISNGKIDVFFNSHSEANVFGVKTFECYVYYPDS